MPADAPLAVLSVEWHAGYRFPCFSGTATGRPADTLVIVDESGVRGRANVVALRPMHCARARSPAWQVMLELTGAAPLEWQGDAPLARCTDPPGGSVCEGCETRRYSGDSFAVDASIVLSPHARSMPRGSARQAALREAISNPQVLGLDTDGDGGLDTTVAKHCIIREGSDPEMTLLRCCSEVWTRTANAERTERACADECVRTPVSF